MLERFQKNSLIGADNNTDYDSPEDPTKEDSSKDMQEEDTSREEEIIEDVGQKEDNPGKDTSKEDINKAGKTTMSTRTVRLEAPIL